MGLAPTRGLGGLVGTWREMEGVVAAICTVMGLGSLWGACILLLPGTCMAADAAKPEAGTGEVAWGRAAVGAAGGGAEAAGNGSDALPAHQAFSEPCSLRLA